MRPWMRLGKEAVLSISNDVLRFTGHNLPQFNEYQEIYNEYQQLNLQRHH
jgi:hypothetical protein